MRLFYFAIALAIFGNVIYHVSQKSIPANVHPIVSIIVNYVTATVLSLLVIPFVPLRGSLTSELAKVNWASIVVGVAIVGVELGFLLAYRAGWNVSLGSVTVNAAATILLIPAGALFFGERMTLTHALGLLFCLIGLVLVTR